MAGRDSITVRRKGRKETYPLDKPAPRVSGDKVIARVEGKQRSFGLFNVIGWIFGGKAHAPDR